MNKEVVMLIIIFFVIDFCSAGLLIGNSSFNVFQIYYSPEEIIRGKINISFENGSANILFRDSFRNSKTLIDFLKDSNITYSCNNEGCKDTISISNPANSKIIFLEKNSSFVGLKITGNNIFVNSFKMEVTGGLNQELCSPPISIDFGNDGKIEWMFTQTSNKFDCNYYSGCYNENAIQSIKYVTNVPYCEEMEIGVGNRWAIGSWIKKGSVNATIRMSLQSDEGFAECILNNSLISQNGDIVYCVINFSSTKNTNATICINSDKDSDFAIRSESEGKICGIYQDARGEADYSLYAKNARYAMFNQPVLINGTDISEEISNYIELNYKNNCSKGCIIPIRINSNEKFHVTISNVVLRYSSTTGVSEENSIYDLTITPVKINTNYTMISLDKLNFSVPKYKGEYNYTLYYGNIILINDTIKVMDIPLINNLLPENVAAGEVSEIYANIFLPANVTIKKYLWEVDNVVVSRNFSMKYLFQDTKNYLVRITIEDSRGIIVSKEFNIYAGTPNLLLNSTLNKLKNNLTQIKNFINTEYPGYERLIYEKARVNASEQLLLNIEKRIENLSENSTEWLIIYKELKNAKIPVEIKEEIDPERNLLISDYYKIMLDYVEQLGGGKYNQNDSQKIKEAIVGWQRENLDVKVGAKILIVEYNNEEKEESLTLFSIKLTPNKKEDVYLIINENFDSLLFKGSAIQEVEKIDSIAGFEFKNLDSQKVIEFAINGKKRVNDLNMFVSPNLNKLILGTKFEEAKKPSIIPVIIISILLIGITSILIYFVLFKILNFKNPFAKKPEKPLGSAEIMNLSIFVRNARKKGLKDEEIAEKLKKAGWGKNNIEYILKITKEKK